MGITENKIVSRGGAEPAEGAKFHKGDIFG